MLNPCTLAEFPTDFSTMEQCHVYPKLCLSYDDLLTALTSQLTETGREYTEAPRLNAEIARGVVNAERMKKGRRWCSVIYGRSIWT